MPSRCFQLKWSSNIEREFQEYHDKDTLGFDEFALFFVIHIWNEPLTLQKFFDPAADGMLLHQLE